MISFVKYLLIQDTYRDTKKKTPYVDVFQVTKMDENEFDYDEFP